MHPEDPVEAPTGWRLTGETTGALDVAHLETTTAWLTTTRGSQHIWDFRGGHVRWTRLAGAGRSKFVGDAEPQRLTRIDVWPEVGGCFFVWFDDPYVPFAIEQWRQSSLIRHIERIERVS